VQDVAPSINGKQYAVTVLGGTQTNVRVHAISDPFTITYERPAQPKALPSANPVTGRYGTIPKNRHVFRVRKGVYFAANQAPEVALFELTMNIPAGSDAYDSVKIRAAPSALIGSASQLSSGMGDTLVSGVM